jgi:acetyltransferase-like isoleucine patch superfamily enzyme/SAM-dependent methyltransferase
MKFTILLLSPTNYTHSSALQEISETLNDGLRQLGYDSLISQEVQAGRRHIVLGSHLLNALDINLPKDSILYNLEQISPDSPWLTHHLLEQFKAFEVWDYSLTNLQNLQSLGVNHVKHVPIGYTPGLSKIPQYSIDQQDIDVLFYGSLNDRRDRILQELQAQGVKVASLFGIYGADRDTAIARAKIVLNIHFYEAKVFEIVRVSYLLANQKFVISEQSTNDSDADFFTQGLVFAPYEELVETCIRWLKDSEGREAIAQTGFQLMTQRDINHSLDKALQNSKDLSNPSESLLIKVDLGCSSRKASGHIGVDICPVPGVDIVADLSQRFPFEDSSVDEVRAHDTIEHLPDRIHTMNEIWRIGKPDALVDLLVPSTDGRGAFQDPTHISFWNLNSFQYFAVEHPAYLELCQQYGFKGAFSLVDLKQYESPDKVIHVHALLRVIKSEEQLESIDNVSSILRDHTFILFPDWTQPEEVLFTDLKTVVGDLALSPIAASTTLLIDQSSCSNELERSPADLLSYVAMDLLISDGVNVEDSGLMLRLMSSADYFGWHQLKTKLKGRIQLDHENNPIIGALGLQDFPAYTLSELTEYPPDSCIPQFAKVTWLKDVVQDNRITIGAYTYADGAVNFVLPNPEDRIEIGKFCAIASNVSIFGGGEHFIRRTTTYPFKFIFLQSFPIERNEDATTKGKTSIGNDVWIGQGVTILSGVSIGDGAVIGAGAVVSKDVPPYSVVAGNPAQVVRYRFQPETIEKLLKLKWWNWDLEHILKNLDLLYQNPDQWPEMPIRLAQERQNYTT